MSFPERIKQIIEHSRLKRDDFALSCGISRAQLFKYLKGDQEPGTGFYRMLKIKFPIYDINWLITGVGEMIDSKCNEDENINDSVVNYQSIVEAEHGKLIQGFKNKERAKRFNQKLLKLELLSDGLFDKAESVIDQLIETAEIVVNEQEKKEGTPTDWHGKDRRKNKAS